MAQQTVRPRVRRSLVARTAPCTRRRQGIATWMLRTYLRQIHENVTRVTLCLLIAKENLLGLYTGAGFSCVGLSSVVHGKGTPLYLSIPGMPRIARRCSVLSLTPSFFARAVCLRSVRWLAVLRPTLQTCGALTNQTLGLSSSTSSLLARRCVGRSERGLGRMLGSPGARLCALQLPLFQVDAFSAKAFGGNPAAVMVLSAKYAARRRRVLCPCPLSATLTSTDTVAVWRVGLQLRDRSRGRRACAG